MKRLVDIFVPEPRVVIFLLLMLLLGVEISLAANAYLAPYLESSELGWIDWQKGEIYGVGHGYLDINNPSPFKAKRAARVTAHSNIVKLAAALKLDDQRTLDSFQGGNFVIQYQGFLRPRPHATHLKADQKGSYYEVIEVAPLHGIEGVTLKILNQLKANPDKKIRPPQRPVHPVREEPDGPWLVLDASHLAAADRVNPAIFPKIVTPSGSVLYDLGTVNEEIFVKRGMVHYVVGDPGNLQSRKAHPHLQRILSKVANLWGISSAHADPQIKRKRRQKYIVKNVENTRGLAKTNLLVSERDAKELKAEDASSKILKNCRVIVVVTSSIGGIESSLRSGSLWASLP